MSRRSDVCVKGCLINSASPTICVSLVSKNRDDLLSDVKDVSGFMPDMIEWRADYFDHVQILDCVVEALEAINKHVAAYPFIFTCRDYGEGGYKNIRAEQRLAIIKAAIHSGYVDIVDIELQTGKEFIDDVISVAHQRGVYVIISYHNFQETPSTEQMMEIFVRQQEAGADIAKIAVMPKLPQDVLNVLQATLWFTQNNAEIPAVSIAMSKMGVISRIAGALFGSAITYASFGDESAPGQVHLLQLRSILDESKK